MRTIAVKCFSCGNVFKRAITGIVTIADLQGIESTCWECNKRLHLLYADTQATKMGLENLQGTDKQVTWANPIRFKVLTELINRLHDTWENRDQFDVARDRLVHVLNTDAPLRKASWWIAHRFNEYGIKSYIIQKAVFTFHKEELPNQQHGSQAST